MKQKGAKVTEKACCVVKNMSEYAEKLQAQTGKKKAAAANPHVVKHRTMSYMYGRMAQLQKDLDGKLQDAARQVRREGGPKKQIDVCVNVDENLISLVVPPLGTRTRQ